MWRFSVSRIHFEKKGVGWLLVVSEHRVRECGQVRVWKGSKTKTNSKMYSLLGVKSKY